MSNESVRVGDRAKVTGGRFIGRHGIVKAVEYDLGKARAQRVLIATVTGNITVPWDEVEKE